MKKIGSIILSFLMFSMSCFASSDVPQFLAEPITNYTSEYKMSLTFDNSDEFVDLLKEMEAIDGADEYIDIEALLRTLFSGQESIKVQTDISDDYSILKTGITTDVNQSIKVNPNLQIGIDTKTGIWLDMDMSKPDAPIFDLTYIHPFRNKYLKIDGSQLLNEMELPIASILNKDALDNFQYEAVRLFMDSSTMVKNGNRYVFNMDNDGFAKYINNAFELVIDNFDIEDEEYFEFPLLDGIKILGEEGLEIEVVLSRGKITMVNMMADISVDLSDIYEASGEVWAYKSSPNLDFTLSLESKISKIGQTKVDFPVLTEDNSVEFDFNQLADDYDTSSEPDYPSYYVNETCDNLPVIDNMIYVPLRQTIEAAYADQVIIGYDNGNITLTSEYFRGYKELKFALGTTVAYTDGIQHNIVAPIIIDDVTYVPAMFFTELFGWTFCEADYDLLDTAYWYSFSTWGW